MGSQGTPTVVKSWAMLTVDQKPYTLAVLTDASLWLRFGTSQPVQLDPVALANAMDDVKTTIAQVNATPATCTVTKTIGTFTLTCDLPVDHPSKYHHCNGIYWLPDA